MIKRRNLIKGGGVFIAGAIFCPSIILAQINNVDSARKIILSGRQRMLIQRAGKFVCLAYLSQRPRPFLAEAEKALELHRITSIALLNGDDTQGLKSETNAVVIKALNTADSAFSPYGQAIRKGIDDTDDKSLREIAELNGYALEEMDKAVSIIERIYKNKVISEQLAMLINISGRQRMLTQQIILQLCLIRSGVDPNSIRQDMYITINRFSTSLNILKRVTPHAVKGKNLDAIIQGLSSAQAEWNSFKAFVSTAVWLGKDRSPDYIFHADKLAEKLLLKMNELVLLYEKSA
ncbi:MAG: type IV pili methyl-accepting chemotaxis transducer N-terminal domain-containing protein [Neptuniibacter sp.]